MKNVSSDRVFHPTLIIKSISKSGEVAIMKPRKRHMVLKVTVGTIVAIAIVIGTAGTNFAITRYIMSADDCKERTSNMNKAKVLSYFKSIIGHQVISGLHIFAGGTNHYKGLEIIKSKSGKTPAILSIEMPNHSAGVDIWQSFTNQIISHWKDGYFIQLVWEKYESPIGTWVGNEDDFNCLIENGCQFNKVWKDGLDNLAVYLKQLQTAGVVHILDILPMLNVHYALWSGRRGINGTIKLYQFTHDYLTMHHGLDSLMWTLSFDKNGDLTSLEAYWPGDQYVDVVSIYLWGKHQALSSIEYQHVLDVAKDKLIAMENIEIIPTYQLLDGQPWWTWFAIYDVFLVIDAEETELQHINSTFNHPKTINKETCKSFKSSNG